MCGLGSISTGCSPDDDLAAMDCWCLPGVNATGDCQGNHLPLGENRGDCTLYNIIIVPSYFNMSHLGNFSNMGMNSPG